MAKQKKAPANNRTETTLIVPFFRASTTISKSNRHLFSKTLSRDKFFNLLYETDPIFRQNSLRIFAASLLAAREEGTMGFVEGWSSNRIELNSAHPARFVTGSYMSHIILKMLQRHQLTPFGGPVIRQNKSCCTWEEINAVLQLPFEKTIIVANSPCPSGSRVTHYCKLKKAASVSVHSPQSLFDSEKMVFNSAQQKLIEILSPSLQEKITAPIIETPNWVIHTLSRCGLFLFPAKKPLELWLAQKLRS